MWSNPQKTADLVTFTEGILNGKLHFFFCSECAFKVFNLCFRNCICLYIAMNLELLLFAYAQRNLVWNFLFSISVCFFCAIDRFVCFFRCCLFCSRAFLCFCSFFYGVNLFYLCLFIEQCSRERLPCIWFLFFW